MVAQKQAGQTAILEQAELELLGSAWQSWASAGSGPARWLARQRLYLHFLLIRYGGLRPGEIPRLNLAKALDLQSGLLRAQERSVFLPAAALRALRPILALREAADPEFTQLDTGFLRRTFAQIARLAGLPPPACSPRALRYARGRELLAMRMPPHLAAKALGFNNPLLLGRLLEKGEATGQTEINIVPGLVERIDMGNLAARIFFELPGYARLCAICSFDDLLAVEPAVGQTLKLYISAACVLPLPNANSHGNSLACRVIGVSGDQFETLVNLRVSPGLELCAIMANNASYCQNWNLGEKIAVHIPAHAVKLRKPNY